MGLVTFDRIKAIMSDIEITITLNRIKDLEYIEELLKSLMIQAPVFIIQLEDSVSIDFTTDYGYFELDTSIIDHFSDYEFVREAENGRKEIRMQIHRYESPLSIDGWGRPLEKPLDETIYLVKRSSNKTSKLNPKIKVLFEDVEHTYYINIVPGKIKDTGEKGYLVKDNYENLYETDSKDVPHFPRLYKKLSEAYWSGFDNLKSYANMEFDKYLKEKKKQIRKQKRNDK